MKIPLYLQSSRYSVEAGRSLYRDLPLCLRKERVLFTPEGLSPLSPCKDTRRKSKLLVIFVL